MSDEQAAINAVATTLRQHLAADYPPGTLMRRDAHPKMHGCVQAEVFVHHELPSDCRKGVFATPGRVYSAWVRFSNAFGLEHDLKADTRGMAVKLLDVHGTRLPGPPCRPGETTCFVTERSTQDFLAATYDAFFIPDAITYVDFPAAVRKGPIAAAAFFVKRGLHRGSRNLFKSLNTLAMNPLAVTYFSQTPYALGHGPSDPIVKFRFEPLMTDALGESLPNAGWFKARMIAVTAILFLADLLGAKALGRWLARLYGPPDLLRDSLARSLQKSDAWFDLRIQRRVGLMSVEDATDRWDEGQSPFESVAWIRIPRQVFSPRHLLDPGQEPAAIAMESTGEHLSFNPWQGIVQHQPLGSINRSRRVVYPSGSQFRHEANGAPMREPTVDEFNALAAQTRLAPGGEDPRPVPGPAVRRSRWWKHYFRRVPLLTALVACLFPLLSIKGPLAVLTHGVFDVRGAALLGVALLVSLLAFTVLVEWWVITAYGDRRFRTDRRFYVYPIRPRWYFVSLLLAVPTMWATWNADRPTTLLARQDWAFQWFAGMALALLVVWSVRWTADFIGGLPPVKALAGMFLRFQDLGAGYVDVARQRFLPGQTLSLGLFVVTSGIALMLGALTLHEVIPRFGALQFALLLIILISSLLAAATFFFDRFNVPVLLSVVTLALMAQHCPATRYQYELLTTSQVPAPLSPAAVVQARAARSSRPDRAIIVTASGGGTQSAAWTAWVLGELTDRCRRERCGFDESVAMISGTSGGAVGAMQFAGGYEGGRLLTPIRTLEHTATRSTHAAIWRTLLYQDSIRSLKLVWNRHPFDDRGRALERTWELSVPPTATLSTWREDARRGDRPAVIFTSTISETGEPFLLSTGGDLPAPARRPPIERRDFFTEFPCRLAAGKKECFDLPVARAARLSATFPVVTPSASDSLRLKPWHPVDGGYSDTWGVDAAVAWIGRAIEDGLGPVKRLQVIQLRTPQLPDLLPGSDRSAEQDERNRRGLALVAVAAASRGIAFETVSFDLRGDPAVAWHLTASERASLERQARHLVTGREGTEVISFLRN